MRQDISDKLHEQAIIGRVSWLIKLRWLAVCGMIFTVLFVDKVFPITLPLFAKHWMLYIAIFIAGYNVILLLRLKQVRQFINTDPDFVIRCTQRLTQIQIVADLICLTIILDLSGGLINPLCMFMLFHIAIAGIILSRIQAFRVALLACMLLLVMGMIGALFPDWRVPLKGFPLELPNALTENWFYIFSVWLSYTITFFLIAYFTTGVSGQLREALDNLERANNALREQDKVKSRLLRVVAHQLRSPLAAIISLIHAYQDTGRIKNLPSECKDLFERIDRRCQSMMELISDLLRLTQIKENLDEQEQLQDVNIYKVALDVVQMFSQQASDKGLELNIHFENEDATIRARERDIADIIGNLVSNAIKYTEKGKIEITGSRVGDKYILTVSDTGIGIPEEDQPKLFDEFYRASNAKKTSEPSSGLGLNIVKAIVTKLGGEITFTSKQGQGTKFIVTLPLSPANNTNKNA